jgi:Domain of unknown function (DUF4129)
VQSREVVVAALGRRSVVAALGAVTLLVVVWAAAIPRPKPVIPTLRRTREVRQIGANDEFGTASTDLAPPRGAGRSVTTSDTIAFVLGWSAFLVVGVGALVCLVLLWRAWRRAQDDRTPPVSDAADLDLEALAEAVTGDSSQRLAALSAGTPAEGIIAAWTHLEATLHEAGVPLPPSRTSTEVSVDVLRRYRVEPETLATLAALYREARWSEHPLAEDDRGRAATAYRSLDADLRSSPAAAQASGRARG